MALTNAFYEAVNSGNVRRVRIMMKDSLLVDLTFNDFNEMAKAAASMTGLYDIHDGKNLDDDVSHWNDSYMNRVMVDVVYNFSHERLEHLKKVIRQLRPLEKYGTLKTRENVSDNENEHNNNGVAVGAGVVVGAAIGGGIALLASAPVLGVVGGAAAGAAIGGIAAAVLTNGGK